MEKKDPYKFTIGFDKSDPNHVYVADLLNETDKKAKLIVQAILAFTGNEDNNVKNQPARSIEPELLRPIMQEIIQEEVKKALALKEDRQSQKELEEVDLTEELPMQLDESLIQDVTNAISAFRKS